MKKLTQRTLWLTAVIAMIGVIAVSCDNGSNTTHSHDWGGWTETTAATCSATGVETRACLGCSETQTQEIGINSANHAMQPAAGSKLPTCSELGYGGQECADCDYTVGVGDIPMLDHTFTEWEETTPATCLVAATDTEKCGVCGALGTVTEEGHDPLDHSTGELSGAKEATCFEAGYTGGTGVCVRDGCGITLTEGTVIDQLTHHYHDWTDPTCTTAGNNERECVNDCGTIDTRTEGFAALGHDGNWATYTIGSGIRNCQRGGCSGTVGIGDTGPAGGIIFYVVPSGITIQGYTGAAGSFAEYTAYYLEAAPANASGSTMSWSNTNVLIPNLSQNDSDTTDRAIGRGRLNTALIAAAHTADTAANNAAKACDEYSNNGFSDWFLPSKEELNQMYIQKSHVGGMTFFFWSSSQFRTEVAWAQNIDDGIQGGNTKNADAIKVRAIRAF